MFLPHNDTPVGYMAVKIDGFSHKRGLTLAARATAEVIGPAWPDA
jgi:hypothetical protein